MGRKARNILGQRFGRLVTIAHVGSTRGKKQALWLCKCDCGNQHATTLACLVNGRTKSCGCIARIEYKGTYKTWGKTSTWESWSKMRHRCNDSRYRFYERYGGRGITVCERWQESFVNFLNDMGERPTGTTIDRIDFNGNYEPLNCRWSTQKEQMRNTSKTRWIQYKGDRKPMSQWAEELGLNPKVISQRLSRGWTINDALETPLRQP